MGSGLILLLIVGAWLAVLVPMALRSHDAAAALGTVDKFHDAMRVLSRRDSGRGSGPVQDAPADPVARPGLTPAARRRRALLVLLAVAVLTLVGGLVGPVWLLAPHLVADLLLVAFLGWLRNSAVVRAEREWRTALGDRHPGRHGDQAWSPLQEWSSDEDGEVASATARVIVPAQPSAVDITGQDVFDQDVFDQDAVHQTAVHQIAVHQTAVHQPAVHQTAVHQPARAQDDVAHGAPAPAGRSFAAAAGRTPSSSGMSAVPAARPTPARGAQGEPWQPVPVPVPTYVTAARAPRRLVDLARPRPAADALTTAEGALGTDDQGRELDHILGRRAVGG